MCTTREEQKKSASETHILFLSRCFVKFSLFNERQARPKYDTNSREIQDEPCLKKIYTSTHLVWRNWKRQMQLVLMVSAWYNLSKRKKSLLNIGNFSNYIHTNSLLSHTCTNLWPQCETNPANRSKSSPRCSFFLDSTTIRSPISDIKEKGDCAKTR